MSAESPSNTETSRCEKAPLVFIPRMEACEPDCIENYIRAMLPYFYANGIRCAIGETGETRPADLYYAPSLKETASKAFSMLQVSSMHPSACGFRCAERIKRYREPISPGPVYISRCKNPRIRTPYPTVWDQLAGEDKEATTLFRSCQKELARQTVRGICDYFSLPFQDPHSNAH